MHVQYAYTIFSLVACGLKRLNDVPIGSMVIRVPISNFQSEECKLGDLGQTSDRSIITAEADVHSQLRSRNASNRTSCRFIKNILLVMESAGVRFVNLQAVNA